MAIRTYQYEKYVNKKIDSLGIQGYYENEDAIWEEANRKFPEPVRP